MAEVAVLVVWFEHSYTTVKSVGSARSSSVTRSSAISTIVAHLCSVHERSADTRDIAAPTVHRLRLTVSLIIHDKAASRSRGKTRYRLISQRANGLRDYGILTRRNGFTPTIANHNPGCSQSVFRVQPSRRKSSPTRG